MIFVFGHGGTGNQKIIKIYEHEGKRPENRVHQALECLSTILQPERHSKKLGSSERGHNGRFWDMVRMHRNLVVCLCQVDLGKDGTTPEPGSKITHQGKLVSVVNSCLI